MGAALNEAAQPRRLMFLILRLSMALEEENKTIIARPTDKIKCILIIVGEYGYICSKTNRYNLYELGSTVVDQSNINWFLLVKLVLVRITATAGTGTGRFGNLWLTGGKGLGLEGFGSDGGGGLMSSA